MVNEEKLDRILLELGHDDFNRGTAYIRRAVGIYEPGMYMTKELYPTLAEAAHSTPSRVERCMRHKFGLNVALTSCLTIAKMFLIIRQQKVQNLKLFTLAL